MRDVSHGASIMYSTIYVTEYLRDYILSKQDELTRIDTDQQIYMCIRRGLFTMNDWRETFTYICAPIGEKTQTVTKVLTVLSSVLGKEPEHFIKERCHVKLNTDLSYALLSRIEGLGDYL